MTNWDLRVEKDICGIFWKSNDVLLNASSNVKCLDDCTLEWTFKERKVESFDKLKCDTAIIDCFESSQFLLTRTICYNNNDKSKFYIGLTVRNIGNVSVLLDKLVPLMAEGEGAFALGDQYKNWSFMRQGRHKNDIPSVCVLGEIDARYTDALKGMVETGTGTVNFKGDIPEGIISDELTVIRANKGNGPGSVTFGFLPCLNQLVSCEIKADRQKEHFKSLELCCHMDGMLFEPGECVTSEWLRVDGNQDPFMAIDDYVRTRGFLTTTKEKRHLPMAIYFTWYFYGDSVREIDVLENLNFLAEHKIPTDSFQIDSGWESRYGDWEANPAFPHGMKFIADKIREKGMIPGIWTAPFITEPRSKLRYEHPEWLLYNENGSPFVFQLNADNCFYVLDITHPEVLLWLEELYRKMTFEWGFTYHKLDFTRAAVDKGCIYYNKKVTRAQAYKNAMEAVRKGAGEDTFIAICGGLFSPGAMFVDSHRTSSDVRSMWPKPDPGETESAPNQLKQNMLRYWMNELWHNDPDALIVRRRKEMYKNLKFTPGLLNDHEAEVFALNEFWSGGLVAYMERMCEIDHDRLMLWRRFIPMNDKAAVPRDMFTTQSRYPAVMDSTINPKIEGFKQWHVVSLVNWGTSPKDTWFTLNESYVGEFAKAGESFIVSELYSGKIWKGVKYGDNLSLGEIEPHAAAHLRVAVEENDKPQLVYTNGNFSMGATEITSWKFDKNTLSIGINWRWDTPLTLNIKLPEGMHACSCEGNPNISTVDDMLTVTLSGRFCGNINV